MPRVDDSQAQVVRFLRDAANWPMPAAQVRYVETHISHLFLAGDLALKMKKALKLPYLDFSTLDNRARYCRRELEVNAQFSPELYLGLARVRRDEHGALRLHLQAGTDLAETGPQAGKTLEWLVCMRRFDEHAILANRYADAPPPRHEALRLAHAVCAAHRVAEPRQPDDAFAMFAHVWQQVHDALLPHADALKEAPLRQVLDTLHAALRQAASRLDARRAAGLVRRCHGDLHLGNIVMIDGQPRLFDAIEFDETLATIDVLYDLAFLLMDLRHRGYAEAANAVMNSWLAHCDEARHHADIDLLAPMMSLRALIRAMVLMDLAVQQQGQTRVGTTVQAAAYVHTAASCLRPASPVLVAVGGLSGSGKTTLAAALAARLAPAAGMVHLRSDVERKVMAGVDEFTRLPPGAYTREPSRQVYERLYHRAALALKASWPVIVDAVFARPEERAAIEAVAHDAGVPFIGLWLQATPDVLRQRIAARRHDASDASVAVLEKQLAHDLGDITWRRISAEGAPEEVLQRALAALPPGQK